MNIDNIIAQVATISGTYLNEKDPIITNVILNKIIVEEYIRDLEIQLSESITNITIKEDLTITKLLNMLEDNKKSNHQETKRILNQFADNLQSKLHATINHQPTIKTPYIPFLIIFIVGIVFGGLITSIIF
jgi:ribosome-binding factor A